MVREEEFIFRRTSSQVEVLALDGYNDFRTDSGTSYFLTVKQNILIKEAISLETMFVITPVFLAAERSFEDLYEYSSVRIPPQSLAKISRNKERLKKH
jgi:hypothetical protein